MPKAEDYRFMPVSVQISLRSFHRDDQPFNRKSTAYRKCTEEDETPGVLEQGET